MHPKNTLTALQDWIKAEIDKNHSIAVRYIEDNIDLIDTDLQKFMDDCPKSCQLEVYEMLLKAGIDMKDYTFNKSLKRYDLNPQFQQYYTIDYKEKMDEYITETISWKTDWLHDAIVLDTIPVMNEG